MSCHKKGSNAKLDWDHRRQFQWMHAPMRCPCQYHTHSLTIVSMPTLSWYSAINNINNKDTPMTVMRLFDSFNMINEKCIFGYDSWDDKHCYLYAMPFCQCELFAYISKHFPQSQTHKSIANISMQFPNVRIQKVAHIFHQICSCIRWLHGNNYCHSDLSLENVMISDLRTLEIKVIDLGLAQRFKDNSHCLFEVKLVKFSICPLRYMMCIGTQPYSVPNEKSEPTEVNLVYSMVLCFVFFISEFYLCFFYLWNFIFVVLKKQIEIAICFIFNWNLFYLQALFTCLYTFTQRDSYCAPGQLWNSGNSYEPSGIFYHNCP